MTPKIKICGITKKIDAVKISSLGVNMLGFVFYERSKRYILPDIARDIINELPTDVSKVGIFVDAKKEDIYKIADDLSLDMLQFHGKEPPEYCASFKDRYKVIKAFRLKRRRDLKEINDYDVDFYLLDTYVKGISGGTGKAFNWDILKDFEFLRPIILSGGITPENVARAITEVSPYAIDVSSGVESSPGDKDIELVKRLIENVRKIE